MAFTIPELQNEIVENGKQTQELNDFFLELSELDILSDTGSPEGVVKARAKKLYMDDAGTAGNILYIKRDADIGGDTSQGWILI